MIIDIDEILRSFELNNPYLQFYLHKSSGRVEVVTEIPGVEPKTNVMDHPDKYIKIPSQKELNLPEMIKGFVPKMKDAAQRAAFQRSIEEGKTVPELEAELSQMGLVQYWYTYEHLQFRKIAEKWCRDNKIDFE